MVAFYNGEEKSVDQKDVIDLRQSVARKSICIDRLWRSSSVRSICDGSNLSRPVGANQHSLSLSFFDLFLPNSYLRNST